MEELAVEVEEEEFLQLTLVMDLVLFWKVLKAPQELVVEVAAVLPIAI